MTATWSTWKCTTAPAPALRLTQKEKVPKANGEHGRGGESAGEEGDYANALAPDETFDMVQSGARLILDYDAASNSFKGTVENTTEGVLERVRVEVHLSNGTELGPTTPTGMAPGELLRINLPATEESFTGWTAHVEVGSGEHGAEAVNPAASTDAAVNPAVNMTVKRSPATNTAATASTRNGD